MIYACENMTWFDVCLYETGSINLLFDLLDLAAAELTADVPQGVVDYQLPIIDNNVSRYFRTKSIIPATGGEIEDITTGNYGDEELLSVARNMPVERYVAIEGQTPFDVALYLYGGVQNLFAIDMPQGITADIDIGTEIVVSGFVEDEKITNYFRAKKIIPATAMLSYFGEDVEVMEGIDYWAINIDFIVT